MAIENQMGCTESGGAMRLLTFPETVPGRISDDGAEDGGRCRVCRGDFPFDDVIECRVCGDSLCGPCALTEEAFESSVCQKCIPRLVRKLDQEILDLRLNALRLLKVPVDALTEIHTMQAPAGDTAGWCAWGRAKKRAGEALGKLREMAS